MFAKAVPDGQLVQLLKHSEHVRHLEEQTVQLMPEVKYPELQGPQVALAVESQLPEGQEVQLVATPEQVAQFGSHVVQLIPETK